LLDSYAAFGIPLGEAFQLRDDVLGVFGDPHETGKPAGDDLREGKRTVLVAKALELGGAAARGTIDRYLGDPALDDAGVARVREVMTDSGALEAVEKLIHELTAESLAALDAAPLVDPDVAPALRELAIVATVRTS
jgi:geranylgeranyl diphosphate synthase type I